MPAAARRWDVFCKVVDNFGDAGVCWRLARILVREHGLAVTLWIDEPQALVGMAPGVDPARGVQQQAGVTLRRWSSPFPAPSGGQTADVVVEGFGCGLPDAYVAAIAARPAPPAWFVLEYLSAERWVDGAHARPSPHPALGLPRRFWFPGFTGATGGLLRERDLVAQRQRFRADPAAQAALWSLLEVPPPTDNEIRVCLFCYPGSPLPALEDAWTASDVPVCCLVPEAGSVDAHAGAAAAGAAPRKRGALTLHRIPFLPQDHYDRLLWACDVNFVRGEDSFVRAQWAVRPLIWQAYAQAEDAQLAKLDAFLDRYCASLDPMSAAAVRGIMAAWNSAPGAPTIGAAWAAWLASRPALAAHAQRWAGELLALPELTASLVSAAADAV